MQQIISNILVSRMTNEGNFHLHLVYYLFTAFVGALLCSASKTSALPHWKFVFGFGVFIIVMAVFGLIIAIKDTIKQIIKAITIKYNN